MSKTWFSNQLVLDSAAELARVDRVRRCYQCSLAWVEFKALGKGLIVWDGGDRERGKHAWDTDNLQATVYFDPKSVAR